MCTAADLPMEIFLLIIQAAAVDNVDDSQAWVASLSLVCHACRTIVDPILHRTVRVHDQNQAAMTRNIDRFGELTTHLVVEVGLLNREFYCALADLPNKIEWLTLASGQLVLLGLVFDGQQHTPVQPTMLTLSRTERRRVDWSQYHLFHSLLRADTVTYLHVNHCEPSIPGQLAQYMPKGVRYLVLDICSFFPEDLDSLDSIEELLRSQRRLERILFRTMYLETDHEVKDNAVRYLEHLAFATRDERLWIDESLPKALTAKEIRKQHVADERAEMNLWFSGRQLFSDHHAA
ncbi:hypothetical protein EXIGLDRAFT_840848 [Exidia glandulosa HHB12029]|uniref:F-box domain-containing protein n=1 Tax=Exidia glandulosa HHB12029 TaxID=1314781 RepID=A0A165E8T3_EXIGL|nr:hypothetical protein EXIGLDRAFT_840848 [Exidia glandulosa HHB12029]